MHLLSRSAARAIAAVLVLPALGGCAYYNTFYLAKKYYGEGRRAQERATTDQPAPEAIAKYELTVRQCNKLLTDYPKSKYVDDASYLLGASLYGKGDYPAALRRLEDFLAKYPGSPFVADAQFVKGLAHFRLKEYARADSVFRAVEAAYPKFRQRWALCFYAGETQAASKQYAAATDWYRHAYRAGEKRRERGIALTRLADVLVSAGRDDSAEVVYAQALKVEEGAKQRFEIAMRRGETLERLKRYQEALDYYKSLRPLALPEKREGELELRIDDCLGLLGRHEEAIAGYRDLVQRYAHSNTAYEAQFEIGYLYESRLNDFEGAAREYDKLKAEPPSTFADQAARRSRNLIALKGYREQVEADTTQAAARAAFLLAEIYYFQLSRVDSAFRQYGLVEREFPRSPYAPKAGYARAWIAMRDRSDTASASALTDSVVRRYRGSRYVESALNLWKNWSGREDERAALLDSLLEHPDTSMASVYREPEPEPEPELQVARDTTRMEPARLTPEQMRARMDSIQAVRIRLLKQGQAPYRRRKQAVPGAFIGPRGGEVEADSLPELEGPDSTGTGSSPSAPADTTRSEEPGSTAPPDSAPLPVVGPTR
ncbi:MAG TPA: tetratricopeptide repeat protein [Candidatus Eisenbacteria bacterium]|jgi:TolA-binding protein